MYAHGNLYQKLRAECIENFEKNSKEYLDYAEDEEVLEEIENLRNCVVDFLDKYAKLSAGAMDDYEVHNFYKQTIELLEQGISTRRYQYEHTIDELKDILEELQMEAEEFCDTDSMADEYGMCAQIQEKIDDVYASINRAKQLLEEEEPLLVKTLETCKNAKNRKDKVLCIDRVANMVHERGSYLPAMCGVPLSEFVQELHYDDSWEPRESPTDTVAVYLSKDVARVLDCIKYFGT